MTEDTTSENLYGETPGGAPPAPKGPGLLDQLGGIFTEPVALFKRLAETPVWGWALGVTLLLSVVMVLIWGNRVDVDAYLRPILEQNPNLPAERIDAVIEMQSKMLPVFGVFQVIVVVPLITLLLAMFYWLIGKTTFETKPPSYRQVFSGTVVAGLVALPKLLLLIVVCLLKPIGGASPDKLSPASIGFYVNVEHVKLHALLNALDLFNIASFVMLYLAARYTMRLKTSGAVACAVLGSLLTVGLQVVFAK